VDTAAYKAKLQRGDVIVKVDGKKVEGNVRGIIMKEYKDKTNLVLTARRRPRPSPRLAATPLPPRRPPSTPPPQPLSLSLYRLSLGAWQVQRGVSVQAKLSTRKQALSADI
jgi:membrane-associated protease RseP (regulator of RpoE activity)